MIGSHKTTPSLVLPSHPLAKGLVGCWLLNEGSGGAVLDSSGFSNAGTLTNGPAWITGLFGKALSFDGTDDRIGCGASSSLANIFSGGGTIIAWVYIDTYTANNSSYVVCKYGATQGWILWLRNDTGHENSLQFTRYFSSQYGYWMASGDISTGQWHQLAATYDDTSVANVPTIYVNGRAVGIDESTSPSGTANDESSQALTIAGRPTDNLRNLDGVIDHVLLFDRALSASEIAWLHREPFALLQTPGLWVPAIAAGGSTHDLAGSITAASDLSASVKTSRNMSGLVSSVTSLASSLRSSRPISAAVNATSSVSGALSIAPPDSEVVLGEVRAWRSAVLFNGMTPAAFKLGTVLTGGWFWVRRAGCSVVYRGPSLAEVDFNEILGVANRDAQQVSLPAYLSHEPNASYCYVVRRFNGCGDVEQTTAAAVVVRIDADGRLADPAPNSVFGLNASQVAGHKVRLLWFFCTLDQRAAPEVFNVYWDSGNGQMDFTEPLAAIPYAGRRFYGYLSDSLADGTYSFAVRAGCENEAESMSLFSVSCSIQTCSPQAMTILAVEAIP